MSEKHILSATRLILFAILLFVLELVLSTCRVSAIAAPSDFPDITKNPSIIGGINIHTGNLSQDNGFRGVVSTGTIGRLGENINDFYGPTSWVKAYSLNDQDRTFKIHFSGGSQRTCDDGKTSNDDGQCPEANPDDENSRNCGTLSDHNKPVNGLSRKRIDIYRTSDADGGKGSHVGDPIYVEAEGCQIKTIPIPKGAWTNDPEQKDNPRGDIKSVIIRVQIEQQNKDGVYTTAPGSSDGHRSQHPNHPSSAFRFEGDEGVSFGSWGQFSGNKKALSDPLLYTSDRDNTDNGGNDHVLSTYIKGVPDDSSKQYRQFEFQASCHLEKNSQNIWLKWYDDDVDNNDRNTWMKMEVIDKTTGQTVKTITGYNNDAYEKIKAAQQAANDEAQLEGKPKPYPNPIDPDRWRQSNQDTTKGGEGFGGKGGSDKAGKAKVLVIRGHTYEMRFTAIPNPNNPDGTRHRYGNRIAVWQPFDTAFAGEQDCNPPKTPKGICSKLEGVEADDEYKAPNGVKYKTRVFVTIDGVNNGKIEDEIGNGNKKSYNYTATQGRIHIKIVKKYDNNPGGGTNYIEYDTSDKHYDCYNVGCSLEAQQVDGLPAPESHLAQIDAQRPYTINAYVWSYPTADNEVGEIRYPHLISDSSVEGDQYSYIPSLTGLDGFEINTNSRQQTPGYYNVNMKVHAQLNGYEFDIGTGCQLTVNVYRHFNLRPAADIVNPDEEDPSTIKWNISGSPNGEYNPVNSSLSGSLIRRTSSGAVPEVIDTQGAFNESIGSPSHTKSYANPTVEAGIQYCAQARLNPATGYVGPNNYIWNGQPADTTSGCFKTVNKPYVHFQGSDVSAGGGFSLSCNPNESKGTIYTYNNADSGKGGSGTQFGAQAYAIISGLGSANLRDPSPGVSIFNFANTNTSGSGSSRTTGGNLGGASNFCVPNYFDDKPASLSTADPAPNAIAGSGNAQQYYKRPANAPALNLSGGTIGNGTNQAIFVDGDVNITGDIKYDTSSRTSISQIPSFYLIVKGNIHIDPSVTQLDGVYVAQPTGSNPTTKGIINTCWSATDPVQINQVYDKCKKQLVVNGAFVANKVLLTRSHSSLRYSQYGEHNLGGGTRSCGTPGESIPTGDSDKRDCAAEIFNFSPELYMSQPAINAKSSNKYDAITSLSPVL